MSEKKAKTLPPPVPPKPPATAPSFGDTSRPLQLAPPLPPRDIDVSEDDDRYVSHPTSAVDGHWYDQRISSGYQQLATASAPAAIALPGSISHALPRDESALRLASTSDLELETSGKPMSLKEFGKGKESSHLPCLVKVVEGHRSLCEFYSFGQEQVFVVLEKKRMSVVTCRDQADGSSYAVPLNTTAFDLIPYWMDAEQIRPKSYGKITANELLQNKVLPPVIAVVGEFDVREHRSKKTVPVGTLLFLNEEKKQKKARQGMLHAKNENGEMVQITSDCNGRFSILSSDVRLSLQEAVNYLKPPFTMRTISAHDTLYVNVIAVESVQQEEVLVGMMKATAGATIDNVASFSRMAEVPVNLNLSVVSMVPKKKETLEHIYDYAHSGFYGVMRRPTMHISNPATGTVAAIPNPQYQDISEGQVQKKLGADMKSLGEPSPRQQPTPVARNLPSSCSLPPQGSETPSMKNEHFYDSIHHGVTATVETGDNLPTTTKVGEVPTNDGEPTHKEEAHTSMEISPTFVDEPLSSKMERVEARPSKIGEETSMATSKVEAPTSKEEGHRLEEEVTSLTEKADSLRHEAPTSASKDKTHETHEVNIPTVSNKSKFPISRHQDAQNDEEANIAYLKTMQRGDILQLLGAMNLSAYKKAFELEQIDGETMTCLTADMLSELGVSKALHRLRLMRIVSGQTSAKALLEAHPS